MLSAAAKPAYTPDMNLDSIVQEVVDAFLRAVDGEAPGLVEGLYLSGSVALGNFRARMSDIDFVAVTAAPTNTSALAALERAHLRVRRYRRRPFFDGVYATWDELAHNPAAATRGPFAHEGRFHYRADTAPSPVDWHTVARYGVACRGPVPQSIDIWADQDVLISWTVRNLDDYWRPMRELCSKLPSLGGLFALRDHTVQEGVLGVTRLHYTIATGDITSKQGAGLYALETFPNTWHQLVNECLRIRRGGEGRSLYWEPLSRRREGLAYMDMVIDDAHRLAAERPTGPAG